MNVITADRHSNHGDYPHKTKNATMFSTGLAAFEAKLAHEAPGFDEKPAGTQEIGLEKNVCHHVQLVEQETNMNHEKLQDKEMQSSGN